MGKQMSTYPPEEQRERWRERADELDMSISQFLAAMTEAGMKKFERDVEPDFTKAELREQRSDLLDELNQARERVQQLEEQVYRGERQVIIDFIEENPGAEYHEILSRVQKTAGERLTDHLDFLEIEDEIESNHSGQFFISETDDASEHPEDGKEVV